MSNGVPAVQSRMIGVEETLVPVSLAQKALGRNGRDMARATLLGIAARGDLVVRLVAGRYVVTADSIRAYQERCARAVA
jgi:hypothetical protein